MHTITLASRGRLDQEKGRDRLLPALDSLCQSDDIPTFVIHIYGEGSYKPHVIALAARYPEKIFYHGRATRQEIATQLQKTHYALMPSLFLETFGLTALESLSQGVPVIGYRKGGLKPFILDGLNINDHEGDDQAQLATCLKHILTSHTQTQWRKLSLNAAAIAEDYTAQHFVDRIIALAGHQLPQRILMVSDYTNPIGGIETYLTKVQTLLQSQGSQVVIVGGSKKKNQTTEKYLQLLGTARNPLLRHKIKKAITDLKPDLVWYHSLLRNIGHAGILQNPHGQTRVTYHDLGLMHPFPSRVYHSDQITSGFRGRLSESKWYQRPFVTLKYLSALLIRKKLAQVCQLHLVPSSFLTPMITWTTKQKVKVVGHFTENSLEVH